MHFHMFCVFTVTCTSLTLHNTIVCLSGMCRPLPMPPQQCITCFSWINIFALTPDVSFIFSNTVCVRLWQITGVMSILFPHNYRRHLHPTIRPQQYVYLCPILIRTTPIAMLEKETKNNGVPLPWSRQFHLHQNINYRWWCRNIACALI